MQHPNVFARVAALGSYGKLTHAEQNETTYRYVKLVPTPDWQLVNFHTVTSSLSFQRLAGICQGGRALVTVLGLGLWENSPARSVLNCSLPFWLPGLS